MSVAWKFDLFQFRCLSDPLPPCLGLDIQQNTFTRWVNDELKLRGLKVDDVKTDLKDGLMLINLMEIISGKKIGRYNKHPVIIQQKLENLNIALNFMVRVTL
eukprot:78032-Amorphochlora_amoeboformis.AAC.1